MIPTVGESGGIFLAPALAKVGSPAQRACVVEQRCGEAEVLSVRSRSLTIRLICIYFILSIRSSVYTGRMLPEPTLRVMKKGRDVYEVEVAAARPTRHSVTAGAGDVER